MEIRSDYYDKIVFIEDEDFNDLVNCYIELMETRGLEPVVYCAENLASELKWDQTFLFDHVLYHIETYGLTETYDNLNYILKEIA